ncbi:MAG: sugar-binding protein [Acidiferrobacteraceae bacterium]|jgi:basic membrane protein A|nr:sugar-binding protein [Acidiferrobacteraceae bacterium]MDP6434171.1 BMP family ABC transporter substrate-binding protein [Arenicellales bacterium]MDP6672360.1 BMP family ABC transporter substrate-binding protein [Arenicellales bacterium]MDP6724035.1 BMP family ABC transporter substrate-binding protein [Arenicellales bacterium]|tara:strand:- start:308 stop:1492 length:1185 start_codon:yes stop_codon:yes gene_type:complete
MRSFRVKILALLISLFAFVGGPLMGTAAAAGKVALVLDVGGRGDLSFNDMGFKGADEAKTKLGVEVVEIQSNSAADYLPNLQNAARTGDFDLIVGVGFLLADAMAEAATEFPNQNFAIIDVTWLGKPNLMEIGYEENKGSALVGALSSMVAAHYGKDKIGVVLGIEIPVLYKFEAGYRYGMHWGNAKYEKVTGKKANVGLLWTYTGTFSDIAKGKAATEAMLAQGAGLVYNVAGPLGIGDLEAITEHLEAKGKSAGPPFMIGVDANQDYLGDGHRVLASMMKRVDFGVYSAIESVVNGTFKGGVTILGPNNGGIAMSGKQDLADFIDFGIKGGAISASDRDSITKNWTAMRGAIPGWIWDAVDELKAEISAGTAEIPCGWCADTIGEIRDKYPD